MALVDAVHIETLDDSPLPAIEEAYTAQRPIPVTPGKHRLTISFCHKDMRWTLCSAESASLEVEVHAGEAYLVSYGICREPASLSWDAPNSRWWKFEMPSAYLRGQGLACRYRTTEKSHLWSPMAQDVSGVPEAWGLQGSQRAIPPDLLRK
jgi:hypothetical protein